MNSYENYIIWNKKQQRLIERFKKLTEQMTRSGIEICIDTRYDEVRLINSRKFKRGLISSLDVIADEFGLEIDDKRIENADDEAEDADIPVIFSCDGFYGIKKKTNK